MQTNNNTQPINVAAALCGTRVALIEDWGFFDKGDAGIVVEYSTETALCRVRFDGGAEQEFPAAMLEREVQEFRYRSPGGPMRSNAHATAAAATDAALTVGLVEFDVVEVRTVTRHRVAVDVEAALAGF